MPVKDGSDRGPAQRHRPGRAERHVRRDLEDRRDLENAATPGATGEPTYTSLNAVHSGSRCAETKPAARATREIAELERRHRSRSSRWRREVPAAARNPHHGPFADPEEAITDRRYRLDTLIAEQPAPAPDPTASPTPVPDGR
ncbi:MAG TPA: hypothetical protein VGX28_05790 [Frankiaceae bacterium]|jgi:hypothetical protein|nr:hypothetical protein [Frankiaceae bacterium]